MQPSSRTYRQTICLSPRKPLESARKPLSLPVIHILLALSDGALHGYAIKQRVAERTNGAILIGPGTLYEAIRRLQDDQLIREDAARGDRSDGQQAQRRYYSLTPSGWTVLRHELRQLRSIVEAARANPRLRKGLT